MRGAMRTLPVYHTRVQATVKPPYSAIICLPLFVVVNPEVAVTLNTVYRELLSTEFNGC